MSLSSLRLNQILWLDAASCLVIGAGLLAAARPLSLLLGLPQGLLTGAGAVLLPIAALIALAALTQARLLVWLTIAGNIGWMIASVAVVVMPGSTPNALGVAFVAAQALFVAIMAILEHRALSGGDMRLA